MQSETVVSVYDVALETWELSGCIMFPRWLRFISPPGRSLRQLREFLLQHGFKKMSPEEDRPPEVGVWTLRLDTTSEGGDKARPRNGSVFDLPAGSSPDEVRELLVSRGFRLIDIHPDVQWTLVCALPVRTGP